MKQRPPSPQPASAKPPPIQKPALTPTGPPTLRKRDSKSKDLCPVQAVSTQSSDSSKTKDKDGELLSVIRMQFTAEIIHCTSLKYISSSLEKEFHISTNHVIKLHIKGRLNKHRQLTGFNFIRSNIYQD